MRKLGNHPSEPVRLRPISACGLCSTRLALWERGSLSPGVVILGLLVSYGDFMFFEGTHFFPGFEKPKKRTAILQGPLEKDAAIYRGPVAR